MPMYDYRCKNCGTFESMTPLERSDDEAPCPRCGSAAPRLLSAPRFFRPFSGIRHEVLRRSEKGRDPKVVREGEGSPLTGSSIHNASCGCGHGHTDSGYPPWMLKH